MGWSVLRLHLERSSGARELSVMGEIEFPLVAGVVGMRALEQVEKVQSIGAIVG